MGQGDPLDRELEDLTPAHRWRTWLHRVEAVLFASHRPVSRDRLARVVGKDVSLDVLLDDLAAELQDRPFELVQSSEGWILRTRSAYGPVIRAAAHVDDQALDLQERELMVLAAIAYHQPITRDGLRDIFGAEINRDLIARLRAHDLIALGPRGPRRGAPQSFLTTERFLTLFGLETLQDLPDLELAPAQGTPGDERMA